MFRVCSLLELFDIDVSAYLNNMQSEDVLFALYTACLDPALLLSIQSLYYAVINAVVEHLTAMGKYSHWIVYILIVVCIPLCS